MKTLQDLIRESQEDQTGTVVGNDLIKAAVNKIEKERMDRAVETCQGLIQYHAGVLKTNVTNLRAIREKEQTQAAQVKKIDRAFRYFQKTGIPFPLFLAENPNAKKMRDGNVERFCCGLNLAYPCPESDAWDIPADAEV